jgi:hypothetical protein
MNFAMAILDLKEFSHLDAMPLSIKNLLLSEGMAIFAFHVIFLLTTILQPVFIVLRIYNFESDADP